MRIEEVEVGFIKDSRGQETLEARMVSGQMVGVASVPSGKSRGRAEARVLEPRVAAEKFERQLKKEIREKQFESQEEFDRQLIKRDGTRDKAELGGNLTLALSVAFAKTLAQFQELELYEYFNRIYRGGHSAWPTLPRLLVNLINGGAHAARMVKHGHAENRLVWQEFQVIPQQPTIKEGFRAARELYRRLGGELTKKFGGEVALGDEAGYSAPFASNEQALMVLKEMTRAAAFNERWSFDLSVDVAANGFYDSEEDRYRVGEEKMTGAELARYTEHLIHKYGLVAVEDPFHEEAWHDFAELNKRKGVYVVADDLTTTNPERIRLAVNNAAADAVIIKPNQIGTVTETMEAARLAHRAGWQLIVSHRSGETEDNFIADLAVGLNAWGIKAGAPATVVRLAKYHRLLQIEEELQKER